MRQNLPLFIGSAASGGPTPGRYFPAGPFFVVFWVSRLERDDFGRPGGRGPFKAGSAGLAGLVSGPASVFIAVLSVLVGSVRSPCFRCGFRRPLSSRRAGLNSPGTVTVSIALGLRPERVALVHLGF